MPGLPLQLKILAIAQLYALQRGLAAIRPTSKRIGRVCSTLLPYNSPHEGDHHMRLESPLESAPSEMRAHRMAPHTRSGSIHVAAAHLGQLCAAAQRRRINWYRGNHGRWNAFRSVHEFLLPYAVMAFARKPTCQHTASSWSSAANASWSCILFNWSSDIGTLDTAQALVGQSMR